MAGFFHRPIFFSRAEHTHQAVYLFIAAIGYGGLIGNSAFANDAPPPSISLTANKGVITALGEILAVRGTLPQPQAVLHAHNQDIMLTGPLHDELLHTQAMRVEVIGRPQGDNALWVLGYRIVDIGGGVQPVIGTLIEVANREFALQDGEGAPIVLSAGPRYRKKLEKDVGAKVWIHGRKLVSGTLHVVRYGVLRPHQRRTPIDAPALTHQPDTKENAHEHTTQCPHNTKAGKPSSNPTP